MSNSFNNNSPVHHVLVDTREIEWMRKTQTRDLPWYGLRPEADFECNQRLCWCTCQGSSPTWRPFASYTSSQPPPAWQARHFSHWTSNSIGGKFTSFTWYSTKLTCFSFGGEDKAHLGLGLVGHTHSPVGHSSSYEQSKTFKNNAVWCIVYVLVWPGCQSQKLNQMLYDSWCTCCHAVVW